MFDIRYQLFYVLLLLPYVRCESGNQTRIQFTKLPKDLSIVGLKCAIDHITSNRIVRYNYVIEKCEPLEEKDWFPDLTIEENYNYFRLLMIQPHIADAPRTNVTLKMPEGSVIGLSVLIHIELLPVESRTVINLESVDIPDTTPLHVSIRNEPSIEVPGTIYNTETDDVYGMEFRRPYLFEGLTPSAHRVELRINLHSVDTYLNGEMFFKYQHRQPLSNYQAVGLYGGLIKCHNIQYIYRR